MNKKTILIIGGIIIIIGIIGGVLFFLQKSAEPDIPYYFIAIHNEPYHDEFKEAEKIEASYLILKQMIEKADEYNIKLTLMFTAQWADYIAESPERMANLESWKKQGHEIAAHHHSIYHGNWDGYTNYSSEEAIAQRIKQGKKPETYLGTLEDYINKLKKINPDIKSGCVNDEHDKKVMPDEIIYDTCSGFANFGEPGQLLRDGNSPEKGYNEYMTVGEYKSIRRTWLAHYQITTNEYQKSAQIVCDSMDSGVYGAVTHSISGQDIPFYDYLEFLHSKDLTGEKSKTVSEIIEDRLLPEKTILKKLIDEKTQIPYSSKKQGMCGDFICDEKEKLNSDLCPRDCETKESCKDLCGDGVCQEIVCMAIGCPCSESIGSCPEDCGQEKEKTCSEQNGTICSPSQTCFGSWLDASDSEMCCDEECGGSTSLDYEDSPFGAHGTYNALDEIGVKYKRNAGSSGLVWDIVNPSYNGAYDWDDLKEHVGIAKSKNLTLIVNIKSYNKNDQYCHTDRVCERPDKGCRYSPCNWNKYEEFLTRSIQEFKDDIKYWQIENEPDEGAGYYSGTAEEYALLLKKSYDIIIDNCPDCKVLIAGIAGDKQDKIQYYENIMDELQSICPETGCFDIFDGHTSGYLNIEEIYKKYENVLRKWDKPIWSTEFGPLNPQNQICEIPGDIGDTLIKSYVSALNAGFEKLFWRVSECPSWITNKDGEETATYYAYQTLINKLEGFSSLEKLDDEQYKFSFSDKNPVYILWCSTGSCSLPLEISGMIKVTDYLGNEIEKDANQIVLTESPVFVEEK